MHRFVKISVGPLLAFGLCGCAEMHRGFETVAQAASSPAVAEPVALAGGDEQTVDPEPAVGHAEATPSPREIFDFHPAGSGPDTMRQAFIIDPNDGPLAGDVRRTAAELRTFLATIQAHTRTAGHAPCPAFDETPAEAGCAKSPPRSAAVASRNPLALQ